MSDIVDYNSYGDEWIPDRVLLYEISNILSQHSDMIKDDIYFAIAITKVERIKDAVSRAWMRRNILNLVAINSKI